MPTVTLMIVGFLMGAFPANSALSDAVGQPSLFWLWGQLWNLLSGSRQGRTLRVVDDFGRGPYLLVSAPCVHLTDHGEASLDGAPAELAYAARKRPNSTVVAAREMATCARRVTSASCSPLSPRAILRSSASMRGGDL